MQALSFSRYTHFRSCDMASPRYILDAICRLWRRFGMIAITRRKRRISRPTGHIALCISQQGYIANGFAVNFAIKPLSFQGIKYPCRFCARNFPRFRKAKLCYPPLSRYTRSHALRESKGFALQKAAILSRCILQAKIRKRKRLWQSL